MTQVFPRPSTIQVVPDVRLQFFFFFRNFPMENSKIRSPTRYPDFPECFPEDGAKFKSRKVPGFSQKTNDSGGTHRPLRPSPSSSRIGRLLSPSISPSVLCVSCVVFPLRGATRRCFDCVPFTSCDLGTWPSPGAFPSHLQAAALGCSS